MPPSLLQVQRLVLAREEQDAGAAALRQQLQEQTESVAALRQQLASAEQQAFEGMEALVERDAHVAEVQQKLAASGEAAAAAAAQLEPALAAAAAKYAELAELQAQLGAARDAAAAQEARAAAAEVQLGEAQAALGEAQRSHQNLIRDNLATLRDMQEEVRVATGKAKGQRPASAALAVVVQSQYFWHASSMPAFPLPRPLSLSSAYPCPTLPPAQVSALKAEADKARREKQCLTEASWGWAWPGGEEVLGTACGDLATLQLWRPSMPGGSTASALSESSCVGPSSPLHPPSSPAEPVPGHLRLHRAARLSAVGAGGAAGRGGHAARGDQTAGGAACLKGAGAGGDGRTVGRCAGRGEVAGVERDDAGSDDVWPDGRASQCSRE